VSDTVRTKVRTGFLCAEIAPATNIRFKRLRTGSAGSRRLRESRIVHFPTFVMRRSSRGASLNDTAADTAEGL